MPKQTYNKLCLKSDTPPFGSLPIKLDNLQIWIYYKITENKKGINLVQSIHDEQVWLNQ
jgi:hypothetical protein